MLLPRLIRLKDAPHYLRMDRHRFNREVRPYVAEIKIEQQDIAFDRTDLDHWVKALKKQIKQSHLNIPLKKFSSSKTVKQVRRHETNEVNSIQPFEHFLHTFKRNIKQNKETFND